MKTNLFIIVLIGLVVYVIVRTNKQLTATTAALQADKPLVAIEQVATTNGGGGTTTTSNPSSTSDPVSPVDYLQAYLNA